MSDIRLCVHVWLDVEDTILGVSRQSFMKRVRSAGWSRKRMRIFRDFTLRSLMNQDLDNFDILLFLNPKYKRIHDEFDWKGNIMSVLPTFYDDVTRESKATLEDLRQNFSSFIINPIHRATILRECAVEGRTIFELAPHSRAARQYGELVDFVLTKNQKTG